MNLKLFRLLLLFSVLLVLVACGGGSNLARTTSYPTDTYVAATPTPVSMQSLIADPFWNEPMYPVTKKCTGRFQFSHKLVDVADVDSIGVSPGGHIAPHDHMAYWGTSAIGDQQRNLGTEKQFSTQSCLGSAFWICFCFIYFNLD